LRYSRLPLRLHDLLLFLLQVFDEFLILFLQGVHLLVLLLEDADLLQERAHIGSLFILAVSRVGLYRLTVRSTLLLRVEFLLQHFLVLRPLTLSRSNRLLLRYGQVDGDVVGSVAESLN
jgi:hypothetical protein